MKQLNITIPSLPDQLAMRHPTLKNIITSYLDAYYTSDTCLKEKTDLLLQYFLTHPDIGEDRSDKGIVGIACGILYLFQNKLVIGDIDQILEEVEDKLCWLRISFKREERILLFEWLHYLTSRVCHKTVNKDTLSYLRNRQNLIQFLEYVNLDDVTNNSISFLINDLDTIHKEGIYPTHITKLLNSQQEVSCVVPIVQTETVSILILIRIDSAERERNLDCIIEQLASFLQLNVLIVEFDNKPRYRLKKRYSHIHVRYIKEENPIFRRTAYLNQLLKEIDAPIVGVWDADVIVPPSQIKEAINAIRQGLAAMSFPYNGYCYMLSPALSFQYCTNPQNAISQIAIEKGLPHTTQSFGGIFFVNRKLYIQAGGENEGFYGWGPEDLERPRRMKILGYPIYRCTGSLLHLHHPRYTNSWYVDVEQEIKNRKEFLRICSMQKEELIQYIATSRNFLSK